MTDTAPDAPEEQVVDEAPAAPRTALPPEVQERIDKIKSDQEAREKAAEDADAAEVARVGEMDAARAICTAACGPIAQALFEMDERGEVDGEARGEVVAYLAETHAAHAGALEAAYLKFAGQKEGESNPAPAGEVTQISSGIESGVSATAN